MAPADDPRYVVGIMADNPQRTAEGQPGTTMAPLFHNIAAWLLQRENVPLSPDPGPPLTLQADLSGVPSCEGPQPGRYCVMAMNLRPNHPVGQVLGRLAEQVRAVPAGGATVPNVQVTGVTLRGQNAQPGDLFAALPGASSHGGRYAADAVTQGAVAVLTDAAGVDAMARRRRACPCSIHPDPRSVLGELAATVYGHPSDRLRVIGVTGTSGKTTTTYLAEAGLRSAERVAGLIGTVGVRIDGRDQPSALTTPEAPDLQALLAVMVEQGVDTVVMEVSSHALTLGRVDGVHFAVGGFTNLSRDHLDFHPTMQDYFDAKARLFDPESPTHASISVICIDDDAGRAMARLAHHPVSVSATGRDADWRVENIDTVELGAQEFLAVDPAGVHHGLRIGLPGQLQRRQLPAGGRAAGCRRGVTRAGRAGAAQRVGARQARADRPRSGLSRPGRLRAQAWGTACGPRDAARAEQRQVRRGVRRGRQP